MESAQETAIDDSREETPAAVVLRRWRVLLVSIIAGVVPSVVYALVAPEWFEARLSAVPAAPSSDISGALAGLQDVPEDLEFAVGGSSDAERIAAVLKSTSVTDEVIRKFNLTQRYGLDHIEETRARVWELCTTDVDRKADLVTLSCEDKDPELVKSMVEYFGEVSNRVFRRVSASSASEERRFLQTRVEAARQELDEASKKLLEFQQKHKVIDLAEQSKAVISAIASLEGQLLSKELELSYLDDFSARDEPTVAQLRRQIKIIRAKQRSLQDSQADTGQKAGTQPATSSGDPTTNETAEIFPSAMSVPELRFELERLYREQKLLESTYLLVTIRFEKARMKEARDTPTFQILDQPTVPTLKVRPRRRLVVAVGVAAGTAVGLLWILAPIWWRQRVLKDPR